MTLQSGARLGSFVIVSPLGTGGMGEVYRARDEKLDREVAIKVLPEALAGDGEALARFEREAKAVAALSHPNILQIHDFGKDRDIAYAVTELLDGETLRDRLASGPVPPRKAADLARQIARGLGAAHEKNVVHRDLKPENLFITRDGRVKILDFGLARVATPSGADDVTRTPTRTELTSPGTVMGTVSYMSPEQVRGEIAGPRSDLFSLGVVLYEMLSGQRAFSRDTPAETMTAILNEEPSEAPLATPDIPPLLQRIVQRCIEKRPDERFRSAHDLAFALEGISRFSTPSEAGLPAVGRSASPRLTRTAVAFALLAVGGLAGFAISERVRDTPEPEPVRLRAITFSGRDGEPAVSPDGRLIAFVSARDGRVRIWLKQIADGSEVALTEGPDTNPRFSPDGSVLLFTRARADEPSIYRVAVVGGQPRKLIDNAFEADLSPDGSTLAFLRTGQAGGAWVIGSANADGSDPREISTIENRRLFGVRWSPTGDRFAVTECPATMNAGCTIALVDPENGERSYLFENRRSVSEMAWTNRRDEVVYALGDQTINVATVVEWKFVRHDLGSGSTQALFWTENLGGGLEILAPGTILFDTGSMTQNLRAFVLRDGVADARGTPITRGRSMDRQPVFAPDGETVVFSSNRTGNLDLWAASTSTGAIRRLTDDAANDWDPGLTADGTKLLWSSDRGGNLEIWMADVDGSGARQVSRDGVDAENPTATPDGEWIVYGSGDPDKLGVWKIRPDGSDATQLVSGPVFVPEVSPDGRYALYGGPRSSGRGNSIRVVEIESGREVPFEIDVAVPDGAPVLTYARGRWMPDGRKIVFVGSNGEGRIGLYVQDFVPGRDTSSTRRVVAGFDSDLVTESFGISPSGDRLVLSMRDDSHRLVVAEGVPGNIAPPRRKPGP